MGGDSAHEGTVQVCLEGGVRGVVCDEDWDNQDAAVVCRQLGYSGEGNCPVNVRLID